MADPQVTVGLPFRDGGPWLELAVRSVLAQTFESWELLLVADAARPDEVARAASLAAVDPRVRLLHDGRGLGLATRLNQIAHAARAPLLARMDGDDVMHPRRLERQVRLLRDRADADLACSPIVVVDEATQPVGLRGEHGLGTTVAEVLGGAVPPHPTVMARTRWAREHPYLTGYDRAEDLALWLSVSGRAVCAVARLPLLFYREPRRVDWAKFQVSQRDRLRVIWRLARPRASRPVVWWHASRTLASFPAYRVAGWFGQQRRLLRRRSRALSSREHAWAVRILEQVAAHSFAARVSGVGRAG